MRAVAGAGRGCGSAGGENLPSSPPFAAARMATASPSGEVALGVDAEARSDGVATATALGRAAAGAAAMASRGGAVAAASDAPAAGAYAAAVADGGAWGGRWWGGVNGKG